jgi:hypothetical protein
MSDGTRSSATVRPAYDDPKPCWIAADPTAGTPEASSSRSATA